MLSHDLARELLARRNNDVRVQLLIDDDPTGQTYRTMLVELRDQDSTIDPDLLGDPVVAYDPVTEVIVIRAGAVSLTDPDADDESAPTVAIYGPACTCPPDDRRLPHLDGCPRYDDDRVWSIEDRAECREQAEVADA